MEEIYLSNKAFRLTYLEKRRQYTLRMAKSGLNSFTVLEEQTRYINNDACDYFLNPQTGQIEFMLPGRCARLYLEHYHTPPKTTRKQRELSISAPMFYTGKFFSLPLVYIDIKSCYWQFYKRLWLDIIWPRGKGRQSLSIVADKLSSWKRARNAIPGLTYSQSIKICPAKNDSREQYCNNKWLNPALWYHLNYMLHELANLALQYGVVYIASDGFIFPVKSSWQKFKADLDSLSLKYEIIYGQGDIINWQSYRLYGYNQDNKQKTKCTIPALKRFFDNPLDEVKDNDIRKYKRNLSLKKNEVLRLNLQSLDDCATLKWWRKQI